MSNPAQEEVDRLFSQRTHATSHPEDRGSASDEARSEEEEKPAARNIRSSRKDEPEDDDRDDDDDDYDTTARMSTAANTKQSYILPSTTRYANTGPKGVIADAQNYHRAKRNTLKQTLHNLTDNLSLSSKPSQLQKSMKQSPNSNDDELNFSDSDSNDSFMAQWRQQRLAELQDQYSSAQSRSYSRSPSRRTYGALTTVSADGYLDAIEKSPPDTAVVVLLFDPRSQDSRDVEDELKTLAYKYSRVRFVMLHHEIAEMETVEIPAILAYRGGDVFATLSGVERDGLEAKLKLAKVLDAR